MLRRSLWGVVWWLSLATLAHAQATERPPAGVFRLLRGIVFDSLTGAGRRDGQTYAAADDAAASLLAAAQVSLTARDPAVMPTCPGSTTAENQPIAPPVGYVLEVELRAEDGGAAWVLNVTKRCYFIFRGREVITSRFAEQGLWEARQVDGAWRIVRSRGHRIT